MYNPTTYRAYSPLTDESNRRRYTFQVWLASILLLTAAVSVTSATAAADIDERFINKSYRSGTCSTISTAAFKSCINEAREEYWINHGNCINTDDRSQAKACIRAARISRYEEKNMCYKQKQARNDICDMLGQGPYLPDIDPVLFLSPDEIAANPNPYFPLTPGLVRISVSGEETITVTVLEDTVDILGVTCISVRDIVEENGEVIEDTIDWYAQDIHGNVWYFGEISKNFEDGELNNLDGSWKAGVDGALPGIVMKAAPQVGDVYRQEYFLGEAEDMAEVVSISEVDESVPAADCTETCLVTREFLPIEPDVEEFKYYAPGIGNILVIDPESGDREELVEVIHP